MSEGRRNLVFGLKIAGAFAAVAAVGLAFTFQSPKGLGSTQQGFRGTGMDAVYRKLEVANLQAANRVPEPQPPVDPGGIPSREAYQNVQVLGDVDSNEFLRIMTAITEWVSPEQGCNYCHKEGAELSDDSLYTKRVARRMIHMTRHINATWKPHVGETGVTCHTCHRGQNVPANIWTASDAAEKAVRMVGNDQGQNQPSKATALTSLPRDPFAPYLTGDKDNIRIIALEALPSRPKPGIKAAEGTYALMMHMSAGLGVNCTFCHNSRAFFDWQQSPPQRTTAWHGIRMVRDLNEAYLAPLTAELPPNRLGPQGDGPKVNCATCHQGAGKPLLGASMLKDYPALATEAPSERRASLMK